MWRFTDEGNLENKLRTWTFHSESSKFDPEDGEEGYIEVIDINKVLTFENGKIGFEVKETPINKKQRWSLGEKDGKGWRTIKHSERGKYLTTRYRHPGSFLTVEDLSKFIIVSKTDFFYNFLDTLLK